MSEKNPVHQFCIDRFREGDREDYKYVYDLYYETIYTFVFNLLRSTAEAQDITTETFIKLWRLHGNLESLANIKAFLYITSRNACLDYLRQAQRQKTVEKEIVYLSREGENEVNNEMIEAEVYNELSRKIEGLPDQCQKIFKLIYLKNLSTSEVAEEMGISNRNVLNQKQRAIQILRTKLRRKLELTAKLYFLFFLFPHLF